MRLSLANIPSTLQLIRIEVAPGVLIRSTPAVGWQANEPTSQALGNRWLGAGAELLLPVPSALIPHATNYLVNTADPQETSRLARSAETARVEERIYSGYYQLLQGTRVLLVMRTQASYTKPWE